MERNERKREEFTSYCRDHLKWFQYIFLDETRSVRHRSHLTRARGETFAEQRLTCQDRRGLYRTHARAYRGRRTRGAKVFLRGGCYSCIPVVTALGLLDWYIVEDAFDADQFLDFVETCVVRSPRCPVCLSGALSGHHLRACPPQVPHMQPYPGPCSVVVMDNATIHRDPRVEAAIENAGGVIKYLPAYSPDLMPAELVFSKVKAHLRRAGPNAAEVRPCC